ncbi:MAG: Argininosuccinate lyase, catalyzes the final step in the arginine biosynthesis pathway, partial [Anaerolineales bacterium]|nr:Argininosuccinate lyase, catalyzes the final step in the arginine biosynthesis pathway [Anaerolineales bacterium]
LTVNANRMADALDTSMLATELADYLVRKGVPFREAHHIVGQAVQKAEGRRIASQDEGVRLENLSLEELRELNPVFEADVAAVWDFRAAVNRRTATGGTGSEAVWAQIQKAKEILG